MNERIKKLRKHFNLTQQEFANRLNISRNTIATYEIGKSKPSDAAVTLICREFNVNEVWLRTGEGGEKNMFLPMDQHTEITNFTQKLLIEEDSFKKRVISTIANLSAEEWEYLEYRIKQIYEGNNSCTNFCNTNEEQLEKIKLSKASKIQKKPTA